MKSCRWSQPMGRWAWSLHLPALCSEAWLWTATGVRTDAICTVSLEVRQASPVKNDREPCVSLPLGLRVGTSSKLQGRGAQQQQPLHRAGI